MGNCTWNGDHTTHVTMSMITSADGSSNTAFLGEKAMDPGMYGNTYCNGWDECIYSGGYGGTQRNGNAIMKDSPGDNYGNNWGAPYASGCPFCFLDGHVTTVNYANSGTASFEAILSYSSGVPVQLQ